MCLLQLRRSSDETVEPEAWVNAFLGRIFWDFLGEKYWANVVSKKIQMKLSKIRVGAGASLRKIFLKCSRDSLLSLLLLFISML